MREEGSDQHPERPRKLSIREAHGVSHLPFTDGGKEFHKVESSQSEMHRVGLIRKRLKCPMDEVTGTIQDQF